MKKLEIIHIIVEVIVLSIIASSVFALAILDLRDGTTTGVLLTIAQLIVVLTCLPGAWTIKKALDRFFEWISKFMEEA